MLGLRRLLGVVGFGVLDVLRLLFQRFHRQPCRFFFAALGDGAIVVERVGAMLNISTTVLARLEAFALATIRVGDAPRVSVCHKREGGLRLRLRLLLQFRPALSLTAVEAIDGGAGSMAEAIEFSAQLVKGCDGFAGGNAIDASRFRCFHRGVLEQCWVDVCLSLLATPPLYPVLGYGQLLFHLSQGQHHKLNRHTAFDEQLICRFDVFRSCFQAINDRLLLVCSNRRRFHFWCRHCRR